jgi:hypothetical protein|tara:strand:+ start:1406 stop:1666 length:261 start_codon:yes stop_codon:yes gene_type:complete
MERKQLIETAKRLINDEGLMQLFQELMLNVTETQLSAGELKGMSDEQIGQVTRGDMMADQKILERFNRIKNLAANPERTAPKEIRK